MLQNVASEFFTGWIWLDLEEHNSFMSLCKRMLERMSMIHKWHWHTLTMKLGQPASWKYYSQRHVLHCFTLSCIVHLYLLFPSVFLQKIPQNRQKGSDCYFSQKPSTNWTIGVTPFPSLGATGAHCKMLLVLVGFQLDASLCTVWICMKYYRVEDASIYTIAKQSNWRYAHSVGVVYACSCRHPSLALHGHG